MKWMGWWKSAQFKGCCMRWNTANESNFLTLNCQRFMLLNISNGLKSTRITLLRIGLGSGDLMNAQLNDVLIFIPSGPSGNHAINFMKRMFIRITWEKKSSKCFVLLLKIRYRQISSLWVMILIQKEMEYQRKLSIIFVRHSCLTLSNLVIFLCRVAFRAGWSGLKAHSTHSTADLGWMNRLQIHSKIRVNWSGLCGFTVQLYFYAWWSTSTPGTDCDRFSNN